MFQCGGGFHLLTVIDKKNVLENAACDVHSITNDGFESTRQYRPGDNLNTVCCKLIFGFMVGMLKEKFSFSTSKKKMSVP